MLNLNDIEQKIVRIRSRIRSAYGLLKNCRVCPRACGVNRLKGGMGTCKSGFFPVVASDNLHHGEEPPISGIMGSGTVFFAGCSLGCAFCQNYPISQLRNGKRVSLRGLADMFLRLQSSGAHNINLVTPTHFAPQIMGSLLIAYRLGLKLPIVYNCGGYESLEMVRLWEGIIDVYMPDMKYGDSHWAAVYSDAEDYPEVNRNAVVEMHRQVGPLLTDASGIAVKGLIVRHLVMPENVSGTDSVLRFISDSVSQKTSISLMRQYFPAHRATNLPPINRKIRAPEYMEAVRLLHRFGLSSGWIQD